MHTNEKEYIEKLESSIRRSFNRVEMIAENFFENEEKEAMYNLGILRQSLLNEMDYIEEINPSYEEEDEESED